MSCSTARRTNYIVRNVRLIRAKPGLVLIGTAIGTTGTVRFTQCSIQLSQFSKLHSPEIIVAFWYFDTLSDDILNAIDSLLDSLRIAGSDESMQRFILSRQWLTVLASNFSLLHGALATDDDLGSGVLLHGLQGVSTRPDQQADKVDVRMLFLGDEDLVADANHRRFVIRRWLKVRIHALHPLDQQMTLFFQLLPGAELAGIQPLAIAAVDRLRRWRSFFQILRYHHVPGAQLPADFLDL